jgi:hypothetical protein
MSRRTFFSKRALEAAVTSYVPAKRRARGVAGKSPSGAEEVSGASAALREEGCAAAVLKKKERHFRVKEEDVKLVKEESGVETLKA